ncbi:hypothetical protein GYMLUDRAFT_48022 [Collybiopsis luxurians FD-317 M1]|uniref:Unplaced genomic scaffold GYMLUscaffold_61, whole genome shotgun sequence n=1 Tax=Collybiopsis luxurians FD-317 M1 TaxID=944289 RepID=A0A0D0CJA8_9AGAR|nr:hypothetical protein GYMLUDRAFT_48022 [Collybiopsis luxurians FD-317 M1]
MTTKIYELGRVRIFQIVLSVSSLSVLPVAYASSRGHLHCVGYQQCHALFQSRLTRTDMLDEKEAQRE